MMREFVGVERVREEMALAHERMWRETGSPCALRAARDTRAGELPTFCVLSYDYTSGRR